MSSPTFKTHFKEYSKYYPIYMSSREWMQFVDTNIMVINNIALLGKYTLFIIWGMLHLF